MINHMLTWRMSRNTSCILEIIETQIVHSCFGPHSCNYANISRFEVHLSKTCAKEIHHSAKAIKQTLLGTKISHPKSTFEDDFPFRMMGYVSFLEGSSYVLNDSEPSFFGPKEMSSKQRSETSTRFTLSGCKPSRCLPPGRLKPIYVPLVCEAWDGCIHLCHDGIIEIWNMHIIRIYCIWHWIHQYSISQDLSMYQFRISPHA